jgi:hypothetical protein
VPLCGKEPIVVVLLIEAGGEAFRLPVDRHVFPPCRDREHRATGRIHADSWSRLAVAAPCAMDEWAAQAHLEPLDVLKHEGTGTERRGIQITVDLVNDAGRPCDINVKPMFYVVANGRRLPMSRFMSSGGRLGPPLGPGRRARAELFWSSYCGPALDDYEIYVEIPGRPGAEPMTTTGGKPLPECQRDPDDPDSAGQTSGEWIEAS